MNERAAVTAIVPAFDREDTVGATVTALRSLAPVGEVIVRMLPWVMTPPRWRRCGVRRRWPGPEGGASTSSAC